jgi:phosphoribosyl-ATP pyrophosphohydrolase
MSSVQDETRLILDRLYDIVLTRRDERPDGSYVVSLLDGGWQAIAAKVREESEEVVLAARDESDAALAHEVADLIFHVWVLMASRGVEPSAIYRELADRFGVGGFAEKASRVPSAVAGKTERASKELNQPDGEQGGQQNGQKTRKQKGDR